MKKLWSAYLLQLNELQAEEFISFLKSLILAREKDESIDDKRATDEQGTKK